MEAGTTGWSCSATSRRSAPPRAASRRTIVQTQGHATGPPRNWPNLACTISRLFWSAVARRIVVARHATRNRKEPASAASGPGFPVAPQERGTRTPMRLSEPQRPPGAVRPGPPGAASFPFSAAGVVSRGPHSCHPPFPVLPAATFGTGSSPSSPVLLWRARSPFRLHRNRTCGTEPCRRGQAPKAGAHGARLLSASRRVDLVSCRSPSGRKSLPRRPAYR